MKKVVSIDLNGRAYQVEESGYDALKTYLDAAEKSLAHNPDKMEILADIEQAVADKCSGQLGHGKTVVSESQVKQALESIGPVHSSEEPDHTSTKSSDEQPVGRNGQKLYRLPKEGKIAGVCAGLAAYFGTDVTIMRLLFVLLLFLTQGFMVLIYIVLAIAMNEAKTADEVAAAHGRPGTAKEILTKAKDAATDQDTVARVGNVITVVGKVLAKAMMYMAAVIFGAFTLAWVWVLGAIGLGALELQGQLASLNGFKQVVFVSAVYAVVAVPFLLVVKALDKVGKPDQTSGTYFYGTLVALVVVATVIISAYFSVYADSFRQYVREHGGYLDIGKHSLCIDETRCGTPATPYRYYEQM